MKYLIMFFLLFILSCGRNENKSDSADLTRLNDASQSLNYKFTLSTATNKTWVLIHGLGDDMTKLDGLAELARAAGYSVLQMDLHGHGQTLFNYLREHTNLPEKFDYEQNVIDIEKLILDLKINNDLVIVGHSYGGAIAYALATRLEKNKSANINSVYMLAPYVERIDKFLKSTYNPFRPPQSDEFTDPFLDPILDPILQKSFRTYMIENYYHNRQDLNSAETTELNFRIEAAIMCTKGIRSFDLLDPTQKLNSFQAPLHIIGAENDQVVTKQQLLAFDSRLNNEKVPHTLEFIKIKVAGHLFPRTFPDLTFKKINAFIF